MIAQAARIATTSQGRIYQDWYSFVHNEACHLTQVRPEILASWTRCRNALVDPHMGCNLGVLPPSHLQKLKAAHAELIKIAHPFMEKLYDFVSGSGLIVFLADIHGVILENIGDFDTAHNASKVKLIPGVSWNEEHVGTNGIGTAIKLRRPIQISGAEHYCAMLHNWTCSASPIMGRDDKLHDILQISGASSGAHLHTLGMVVAATEAIKDQLRIEEHHREMAVLHNSLNKIFQTMSDGAIIINNEGIITNINSAGRQIIGANPIGVSVKNLFYQNKLIADIVANGEDFAEVEMIIQASRFEAHCLVSGKIIRDAHRRTSGAVIFINPMSKLKKIVNRFSSSQANYEFKDIIGNNSTLKESIQLAINASASVSNILIVGESGTGKELFAQSIHNISPRANGPFIAMNCAALPRDLISSELFGYVDGAFTGARKGGRPGKFEMASGGTLFLDEIGDMPLDQQATLLRVLQERMVMRVGGDHVIPVDVRVICATNKNLQESVARGHFRSDLYYRLNVVYIHIPPLRNRKDDIEQLVLFFIKKIGAKLSKAITNIERSVLEQLMTYAWPGNVRELENVVEKMVNTCEGGRLTVKDIPDDIVCKAPHTSSDCAIRALPFERNIHSLINEKQKILGLLDEHQGNISAVAKVLGVSRNTIYRKLSFYAIERGSVFR